MTAKRFTFNEDVNEDDLYEIGVFSDNGKVMETIDVLNCLNDLHEENHKIKSLLLKKVEELNDAYDKSAKAGMPTGGIIGELDSFEEVCRVMGWIE